MKSSFRVYNFSLKNNLISKLNLLNISNLYNPVSINISSNFNTFGTEKNLKMARLYNLLFFISGQRPFMKKVKFSYIKKKILKSFMFCVSLNHFNIRNVFLYFINFYIYFFHIYYQKNIKFNFFDNSCIFYIDNMQFFFKNYNKQNQKMQLKFLFKSRFKNHIDFYTYMNNIFLLKIKE
jgi:hypothetical protein